MLNLRTLPTASDDVGTSRGGVFFFGGGIVNLLMYDIQRGWDALYSVVVHCTLYTPQSNSITKTEVHIKRSLYFSLILSGRNSNLDKTL